MGMSILQIEIPDDKRLEWEARAAAQGRDLQTWAVELLTARADEEAPDEHERRTIEGELLKALESPLIEVTPQWWAQFEKETMARVDADHAKQ